MIAKVDGAYVISSGHVWLPGSYDTASTARYAFRYCGCHLQAAQDAANEAAGGTGGVVTMDRLRAMPRRCEACR